MGPGMERPIRPRPAVTLALCGAALALGCATVAFVLPGPPAPVDGTLHATADLVRAPSGGRVVRWLAEPGATVRAGTPLVELEDADRAADLAAAEAAVADAAAALARAERTAALDLAWRRSAVRNDLHAVRAEAATLLRERFDAALGEVAEGPEPAPGTVPARTVSRRRAPAASAVNGAAAANAREVLEARLALCDLREAELLELLDALPETVSAAAGTPAAAAALREAERLREEAASASAALTVHAARFGRLGRPSVEVGESAAGGALLAAVRDDARPFVTARVPTERLRRFAPGTDVAIRFGEGDRRHGYTGRVVSVDPEAGDGVAGVRVLPTGPLWPELPEGAACEVRPAR